MSHVVATIYCNVYRMKFSVKNYYHYYYYYYSRWFVLYGLDRVGWLALFLGLCRCVDDLESK